MTDRRRAVIRVDDEGVVLSGTGGVWRVRRDDGSVVEASLRGRVKKSNCRPPRRWLAAPRHDRLRRRHAQARRRRSRASLEQDEAGGAWAIAEILPRRSRLARRAPGGGQGERVVAANVDQVVVVFAAANPEPHPRMLDRFLVIAEANELAARIVINKVELIGGVDAARARWIDYERAGYPVHYTSVKARRGPRGAPRRTRRRGERAHRTIRRRQVVVAQRDVPRARPARRRDQRVGEQGTSHHGRRLSASASGRRGRLRRRHARPARGGHVGALTEGLDRVLPRAAPLPRPSAASPTAATKSNPIAPSAMPSPAAT